MDSISVFIFSKKRTDEAKKESESESKSESESDSYRSEENFDNLIVQRGLLDLGNWIAGTRKESGLPGVRGHDWVVVFEAQQDLIFSSAKWTELNFGTVVGIVGLGGRLGETDVIGKEDKISRTLDEFETGMEFAEIWEREIGQ